MKKSAAVTLSVTALLAAGLTGCSSGSERSKDSEGNAICVDAKTQERVDENRCDSDPENGSIASSPFLWYFLGRASAVPAFGTSIIGYGGGYNAGGYGRVYSGLPRQGAAAGQAKSGTVSRGGFGKSTSRNGG